MKPVQVGQPAPDATVFRRPRDPVRLSTLRDQPLVLLFFPLAFSTVCTQEMCSMAEDHDAWAELGVRVVGISVDSPYTNLKFAESCNARFPILSDWNKEASEAFGVLRRDLGGLKGVSERAAFVIDREGVVRFSWVGDNPGILPPFDEIKDTVRGLSFATRG